ncbi:MAG: hypothetical protein R3F49_06675 [Planctomycetota bacterium]
MLRSLPLRAFSLALPVVIGSYCVARWGGAAAAVVVVALALVQAAAGAALLGSSEVGRVTWRNRVAGLLVPFGFAFGAQSLAQIAAHSAVVCALLGLAGAAAGRSYWVAAAWVLDLVALQFLGRGYRAQSPGSRARRALLTPISIVLGLAAAGGVLLSQGRPGLAATVAGGPLLVLALFYGVWALGMLVLGRNARWN